MAMEPTTSQLRAPGWGDFEKITAFFLTSPDPDDWLHWLTEVRSRNKKLAETLLLFRQSLETGGAAAKQRAYMHYAINTAAPLPGPEAAPSFDVMEWARAYAASLEIDVEEPPEGGTLLRRGAIEHPCPDWNNEEDRNPAETLRTVCKVINRFRYGRDDVIPSSLFPFDAAAAGHRYENAVRMADLSALAYHERHFVARQLARWGYPEEGFAWIESPSGGAQTDTQAFFARGNDHAVLCFRGTSSLKDTMTDLMIGKAPAPGGRGAVHRGFNRALDSVWRPLQEAVASFGDADKLFVTGHSLGAALAQLAAYRLAAEGRKVAAVYVFGSPRLGDEEFARAYNELLEDRTYLHINGVDGVTRVPPRWLGFHPLGDPSRRFVFEPGDSHALTPEEAPEDPPPADLRLNDEGEVVLSTEVKTRLHDAAWMVREAIDSSTRFLTESPVDLKGDSYRPSTAHQAGVADEHGIGEYLFKFACAIVEEMSPAEWKA